MTTPAKARNDQERTWHIQPREAARNLVEIRELVAATVEAARRSDIVEQWKSQALSGIGRAPEPRGTRGRWLVFAFGLLVDWLRGVWQAHDAALGIEKLAIRAENLLQADDAIGAAHVARLALTRALANEYRTRLWLITAWAGVGQRDPFLTHAALRQLPAPALTVELVAAYLSTCNRTDEAVALLMAARKMCHRSRVATKQLIDLLLLRGAEREAARVAADDRDLLTSRELQALADAGLAISPTDAKSMNAPPSRPHPRD